MPKDEAKALSPLKDILMTEEEIEALPPLKAARIWLENSRDAPIHVAHVMPNESLKRAVEAILDHLTLSEQSDNKNSP